MPARHAYVHIPFCQHICSYCAFYRSVNNNREEWLARLTEQIKTKIGPDHPVLSTLYFGGGTPSLLSEEEFVRLAALFPIDKDTEFTIEANPESVTEKKVKTWKQMGVSRLSLGVQTFQDETLQAIGRRHTKKQAIEAIQTIRKEIGSLSIDLIYGLPDQTLDDVKQDVETFLKLDIPHLSIYSLQIEENSVFGKTGMQPADPDLEADMYEWIVRRLTQSNYRHYEISSFARDRQYGKHNLCYWQDRDFYGFGPGAAGRENGQRYHIDADGNQISDETDAPFECIMMGLRTEFGVNLQEYKAKYGIDLLETCQRPIQKYARFFYIENGHLILQEAGREILNTILVDFLSSS